MARKGGGNETTNANAGPGNRPTATTVRPSTSNTKPMHMRQRTVHPGIQARQAITYGDRQQNRPGLDSAVRGVCV